MVGWVIQANFTVAKTSLFSRPAAKPIFLLMEPNLRTNWGRVLFATCITITPGTVTVDVDPAESGRFIVHALNHETGIDLLYWRLVDDIIYMENALAARKALDAGRRRNMGWRPVGLIVLVFLVLLRAIIGPTVLDRLISINAITSKVSMIILLIAFVREEYGFIDIAFVFMLCGFVSGLWILKALTPGDRHLRLPGVKGFEGDEEGEVADG